MGQKLRFSEAEDRLIIKHVIKDTSPNTLISKILIVKREIFNQLGIKRTRQSIYSRQVILGKDSVEAVAVDQEAEAKFVINTLEFLKDLSPKRRQLVKDMVDYLS